MFSKSMHASVMERREREVFISHQIMFILHQSMIKSHQSVFRPRVYITSSYVVVASYITSGYIRSIFIHSHQSLLLSHYLKDLQLLGCTAVEDKLQDVSRYMYLQHCTDRE